MIDDYSAVALGAFVAAAIADGSTVVSDGWSGYTRLRTSSTTRGWSATRRPTWCCPGSTGCSRTRSGGRWASTTGCGQKHLQAYLDEFVFRFNRRRTPHAAFDRLLGLGLTLEPATYQMLVGRS